jgi:hypothetical protein
VLLALLVVFLSGCATTGLRWTSEGSARLDKPDAEIPEDQLLDVWIELFDPGQLPNDAEEAAGLSMEIREAEARFIPVHLRNTMEKTGYWGAVRVLPQATEGAEVLVRGTVVRSDGGVLELDISAVDASGRQWFAERYAFHAETLDYLDSGPQSAEAFQPLYNKIANDLARFRKDLDVAEIRSLRRTSELRFAADLAPDAFGSHLSVDKKGRYRLARLPAAEDPMYRRIQLIRERDFMLIDTLNGHFDNFYYEMAAPYGEWRAARLQETEALRGIEREALTRKVLGFAAIAGAVALGALTDSDTRARTGTLRDVMVLGGAYALKTGFDKDSETEIHRVAIEELDDSFSAEAQPLVVEVEGETHELTGSAETQYAQWRVLLRRIYASETGLVATPN